MTTPVRIAFVLLQLFTIRMVVVAPYCDRRDVAVLSGSVALRSAGLAMYIIVLLWRIPVEESLMHEEFGARSDEYSRTSWRLIPFLY